MSPKNDPASLVADPRWLPLHIDGQHGALQFVFLPREAHATVPFLTEEYLRDKALPAGAVDLAELPASAAATPHYIFHSAFCCSTLFARALDVPGASMGLKEPQLFNELAALWRAGRVNPPMLTRMVGLLARPFGPGEIVVIKPSNEANGLAEPLLQADARSKALLLYAPLPRFLASVSRKGMWGRIWARRLLASLRREHIADFGFSDADYLEQTDLQAAALAWLLHHAQFTHLAKLFPGRVRVLDSETFLAGRAQSLAALAHHFGIASDENRWAEIASGPAFQQHSKEIGRAFTRDPEESDAEVPPLVSEEIELVMKWAAAVAGHIGIALDSPAPGLELLGPA